MKLTLIIFLISVFSLPVHSAPGGVAGKITSINIKETGYILITLNSPHGNPEECMSNTSLVIAHNHIAKKEMLSLVLSAFSMDKTTSFWITGCYQAYGTSYPIAITANISK